MRAAGDRRLPEPGPDAVWIGVAAGPAGGTCATLPVGAARADVRRVDGEASVRDVLTAAGRAGRPVVVFSEPGPLARVAFAVAVSLDVPVAVLDPGPAGVPGADPEGRGDAVAVAVAAHDRPGLLRRVDVPPRAVVNALLSISGRELALVAEASALSAECRRLLADDSPELDAALGSRLRLPGVRDLLARYPTSAALRAAGPDRVERLVANRSPRTAARVGAAVAAALEAPDPSRPQPPRRAVAGLVARLDGVAGRQEELGVELERMLAGRSDHELRRLRPLIGPRLYARLTRTGTVDGPARGARGGSRGPGTGGPGRRRRSGWPVTGRVATVVGLVVAVSVAAYLVRAPRTSGNLVSTSPDNELTAYARWAGRAELAAFDRSVGIDSVYASDYIGDRSWAEIDAPGQVAPWAGTDRTMVWGVPLLPATGSSLAKGATGAYDRYFRVLAGNLVRAGQGSAILRLGWEFNVATSPWYAAGKAGSFIGEWRDVVATMRSVPGAHFRFLWNPNRGGATAEGPGDLAAYYPGDRWVDIVGLDVYDVGWRRYPGPGTEFSRIEHQAFGLDWLASFAARHAKALAIPEFGLGWGPTRTAPASGAVSGGDDGTFVRDMAGWIRSHGVIEAGFWDKDFSSVADGSNPAALRALRAGFGA